MIFEPGGGFAFRKAVGLNSEHVDENRMVIHVLSAKGKKDRDVTLSPHQVAALNCYWARHPKGIRLFEGRHPGTYRMRSATRASRQPRCTRMWRATGNPPRSWMISSSDLRISLQIGICKRSFCAFVGKICELVERKTSFILVLCFIFFRSQCNTY